MSRRAVIAMLCTMAATVGVVVVLAWAVPLLGASAIGMAKASAVGETGDQSWGQLIRQYEETTGEAGSWLAVRTNGDHWSWDVTYVHPSLGTLWFGVQTRWTSYMNDSTPGIRRTMLNAIGE
jgi:uncharacterized membrane protein YeiB